MKSMENYYGGTTITVVLVVQRKGGVDIICLQVGDSPAYLVYK